MQYTAGSVLLKTSKHNRNPRSPTRVKKATEIIERCKYAWDKVLDIFVRIACCHNGRLYEYVEGVGQRNATRYVTCCNCTRGCTELCIW